MILAVGVFDKPLPEPLSFFEQAANNKTMEINVANRSFFVINFVLNNKMDQASLPSDFMQITIGRRRKTIPLSGNRKVIKGETYSVLRSYFVHVVSGRYFLNAF